MSSKSEGIQKAKILKALIELNKVSKILDSFLPVFIEKTIPKEDKVYLHGNFNLGGTVSGRLSSNRPNMQNLPSSGTIYAKPIKQCFSAPAGWLILGADFKSLEDRISALTTKDRNKLKVYLEGFDGHCLRAYYYFKDQMPDIDPTSVDSINSIDPKYKKLRQTSKAPTFLLTYGGTFHGLMNNCGFDKETAEFFIYESVRRIEKILPNLDLTKIVKWTEDVVCENQYKKVDDLIYQTPTTILESIDSRKNLISSLCQKPTVKESIKLPIETIFNIAGRELENYIENLDESSKGELAKVLMTEDTQLSEEFDQLKIKTIQSLEKISSVNDDVTNNKLEETINQIKQDGYSKINYVRLYSLYNNIQ
jgi:hypothetical protein